MSQPSPANCATCPAHSLPNLVKLGVDMENWDYVVALAGNPNTGKSTVFNALTGLRQHTGNWPGKTVARAEGELVASLQLLVGPGEEGPFELRSRTGRRVRQDAVTGRMTRPLFLAARPEQW